MKRGAAARTESATATQILDVAETLIQTRSYSAFSYQDIADALGIRKASIHYHFAGKADLGAAVVERYAGRFGGALAALAVDETRTTRDLLDFYSAPYLQFAATSNRVCLCGALAAEALALPEPVRARVERFFVDHQAWLARILERGIRRGEITLVTPAAKVARTIFAALQGALLVQRTTGDASQLKDVIATLKAQVLAPAVGKMGAPRARRKK
jgi:TetR/AcrR family transcriptional repressor of nem operon